MAFFSALLGVYSIYVCCKIKAHCKACFEFYCFIAYLVATWRNIQKKHQHIICKIDVLGFGFRFIASRDYSILPLLLLQAWYKGREDWGQNRRIGFIFRQNGYRPSWPLGTCEPDKDCDCWSLANRTCREKYSITWHSKKGTFLPIAQGNRENFWKIWAAGEKGQVAAPAEYIKALIINAPQDGTLTRLAQTGSKCIQSVDKGNDKPSFDIDEYVRLSLQRLNSEYKG